MINFNVFYKLKCWMFWKAKIRWKQIWGNYKLFNLPNPYIASIFSFVPRILGILITLALGFVIGYAYSHFLQFDPYYLWIIIFLLFLFDGVSDGLKTGKWISNTKEEDWLLTSCSLGNIEYLLFLWIDESIWNLRNRFISTVALFIGVFIAIPENIIHFISSLFLLLIINTLITLLFTTIQYYSIKKSIYIQGRGFLLTAFLLFILMPFLLFLTRIADRILNTVLKHKHLVNFWSISKKYLLIILKYLDKDLFPFTSLAKILVQGVSVRALVSLLVFIGILVIANLSILLLIKKRDHIITHRTTIIDKVLIKIYSWLVIIFPIIRNKKHVKLYLETIFKHYFLKKYIVSILGVPFWITAIVCLTFLHNLPHNEFIGKLSITLSLILPTYISLSIPSYIFNKLKVRLSFDSEGEFFQYMFVHGAEPRYIYAIKTDTLKVLCLPTYSLQLLLILIFSPVDIYIKFIMMLSSLAVFFLKTKYVILHSFLVPHYEYNNVSQIGNYPDQKLIYKWVTGLILTCSIPFIPIVAWLRSAIDFREFLLYYILWLLLGHIVVRYVLQRTFQQRQKHFSIEETSYSREEKSDLNNFKKNLTVLSIVPVIYIIGVWLIYMKLFILASIILVSSHIFKNLILINSYNKKIGV